MSFKSSMVRNSAYTDIALAQVLQKILDSGVMTKQACNVQE